jgi:hypothetical protein
MSLRGARSRFASRKGSLALMATFVLATSATAVVTSYAAASPGHLSVNESRFGHYFHSTTTTTTTTSTVPTSVRTNPGKFRHYYVRTTDPTTTTSPYRTTTTAAPTSTTAAPTSTTAAPTSTTAAPTSTTAVPTSTTAAPTSTTAAPTSTTAAPTSTTAAPTSTTAAPTSTTAAPTSTTAAPTSTTAAPANGTPPNGNSAYTQEPGFPRYNEAGTSEAITTSAVGDVVIVLGHHDQTSSSAIQSVTDTSGFITWKSTADVTGVGAEGHHYEIWQGVVNQVGSTTVQINWSGGAGDPFIYVDEWRSSFGSGSVWSVVPGATGFVGTYGDGVDYSTVAFPDLQSGSGGGMYWGYAYGGQTLGTPVTPSGWGSLITGDGNCILWSPSGTDLAANTAYGPTCQQSPASWYDAIGVILQAT